MTQLLVTGVGSNIGQGILKSLRESDVGANVVGTDVYRYAAGSAWCDASYTVPFARDARYVPALIDILQKHGTDLVLIGSEMETHVLAHERARIERETRAKVVVSDADMIDQCGDKYGIAQLFKKANINYPDSIGDMNQRRAFVARLGYPVICKPRLGWSARSVVKIEDEASLDYYALHTPNPVIQEYLEGEEFTCAVVFDRDGRYADHVVMRRDLLNGTTYRAEVVSRPDIDRYIIDFSKTVKLRGSVNIQLRVTSRGPVAFEMNPRFSGTTAIRMKAGFNDVAAVVHNFLDGTPIVKMKPRLVRVLRYWEEMVVEDGDPRFP
ncbi:MAG: ATP-grasp domain-containing protein [Planctomycetes bacterium]|nr:ATP-grasp domain-containing protein [Planctomycetota bacterium]